MVPTERSGPGSGLGFDETASASDETSVTPASTPSDAGRELARLAGRDLDADRGRRYELGACIGRGGMGEVFVARDLDIGRAVAIKRMRSPEPSREAIARFLREAQVQGRLEHPAIVPVHDLGVDGAGRPFFTMKRVTGTLLSELIARKADPRRLLRAFVDVCNAIELAHLSGVVHRDLKPSNIMLGELGEVYVLDWGVARLLGADELPIDGADPGSGGGTAHGAVLGTPAYMAPEQRRGAPDVGPAADVFSLGCVLFEILAGTRLLPAAADRVGPEPIVVDARPGARGIDVAPELESACVDAAAADAAARPSARALGERVQHYLDGDRDAERRRALAQAQVDLARRALAGPDDADRRADAMRAAGRALALDPACLDAAQIVSRLVLEPPRVRPPEVERLLADRDRATTTRQGFIAARSLGVAAIVFPAFVRIFVGSWTLAALAFAIMAGSTLHAYRKSKGDRVLGRLDVAYMLASNAAILVILSRVFGTYVLVPPVAFAAISGLAVLPPMLGWYDRLWLVFAAALIVPSVLEATGVWARTTAFGAALPAGTELAVMAAILALMYAGGRYVHDLAVANREAHARLELHAWHLRQILPPS